MADVRSLLKSERASRRIQHKHASYTPTGTLLCTVCYLQLKSESLWDGHLRSAGHLMRAQKLLDMQPEEPETVPTPAPSKKRKASVEEEGEGTIRKKSRAANSLPQNFFDQGGEPLEMPAANPMNDIQIPSRPATPMKQSPDVLKQLIVDESEWAAFEADIAAVETVPIVEGAVISAKPVTAAELEAQSIQEKNQQRKERAEAELEGDREDASRKMEIELEQMEGLEERVRKMRERREALRKNESMAEIPAISKVPEVDMEDDDEDEEDDEDDDWDGFRMKG